MIKVVCIDNIRELINGIKIYDTDIKIGEIYDALGNGLYYKIIFNGENIGIKEKRFFITLAEWREQQINSILDEL